MSIEVRDELVDACVDFYGLLGFERVEPPATLADAATWLEQAGTQIHLLRTKDPVSPPAGHHAVVVERYDETLAVLRRAGFEAQPRHEHWGAPRSFVRDPAGHRVELMAAPPSG